MIYNKRNKLALIDNELLLTPAHKLSQQIKDGSLSALKLCQVYIERIKQVNPIINAMTQDRFSEAQEEARRLDELLANFRSDNKDSMELSEGEREMLNSPLLGIPISIKESIKIKGMKNTCGLFTRRNTLAEEDAVVLKNVKRFGMIPICTTNVPECTLYWADCQNTIYGRTLNPYDLSRITGASSGGEGSLIAAGCSVMGIGSDIGGSLRIPAHYCGINSHKASPFLISSEGNYPEIKEHRLRLFTLGPMCRYASDLRPLFKCLLQDKENSKLDTYFKFQPENIKQLRDDLLLKLDDRLDLSQLKLFYFNFNSESQLKGKQSVQVVDEFMESQLEILNHFRSKFNCSIEHLNLDKFLKKTFITWQCMLAGGGTIDKDLEFNENELKETFGIDNIFMEYIKIPLGLSKHTKESLLTMSVGSTIPKDRSKAFPLCEKFEFLARELKNEIESILGDNGILIMPTLPTVAYKHSVSLLKTQDLRFPSLFNYLQLPVTHVHFKLDKKHKLPYGFSLATKPYNDHLSISLAEEIELTFGGWQQPATGAINLKQSQLKENSSVATAKAKSKPLPASASSERVDNQPDAIPERALPNDNQVLA